MTRTIKAEVDAPDTYPREYIIRDLVVQIFTQVEDYISFYESKLNQNENRYRAELKIVINEKGDC